MRKLLFIIIALFFCNPSSAGILFDNTDDVLTCGSDTSLDNLKASGLTVSTWVYAGSNGGGGNGRIFAKHGAGLSGPFFYWTGTLAPAFEHSGSTALLRYADGPGSVTANTWTHLLVTWDGSTTATNVKIYKNGTEITYLVTQNGATLGDDSGNEWTIGNRDHTSTTRTFDGKIGEMAVWSSVLSATDISILASSRTKRIPLQVSPSTLVAYWPGDECSNSEGCGIKIRTETTGSGTTNGTDGTFSITKPATVSNGDYLVAIVGKIATNVGSSVAPATGWTTGHELRTTTGNDVYGGTFYKLITNAAGEPSNYTFDSNGTSESFAYWIGSVSGIDQTTPEDVAFNGTGAWANLQNDTSPNLVSVTTVTKGAWAVAGWVVNADTTTTLPGGVWATRGDDVGGLLNVVSQYLGLAGTGTGTAELTAVATNQETQRGTFVFRPARSGNVFYDLSTKGNHCTALYGPTGDAEEIQSYA